jgi:hypothetical protein
MTPRAVRAFAVAVALGQPAVAAAQGPPSAEDYRFRIEYREFRPVLSGEVERGSADVEGTRIDLEDDLGLPEKRTFALKAVLRLAEAHKLRGSYTPFSYRGDVTARRSIRFEDTTFERFTRVVTDLKGGYYTAEYEWDFIRGSGGYLGLLVGAKIVDADTLIVGPNEGIREQETLRVPIPVLGATTRVYAGPRLSIEGELSGLSIGSRGYLYEMDFSARLHLSDRLAIGGGYRLLRSRGEDDLEFFELRFRGWQFGLEIGL